MMGSRPRRVAFASLLVALAATGETYAQRRPARRAEPKATARPASADRDAVAADRVVLRGGEELLGQVVDAASGPALTVLARRAWIREHLPDRLDAWEAAERDATTHAQDQRRRRLQIWRRERPSVPAAGDRITAWLDRELADKSDPREASPLMALPIARADATTVQRRGAPAARGLRQAWLLELPDPESTPWATLSDTVAGRGTPPDADDPVSVDRLLPPLAEPEDRWLLRRAATEVLYDDGLRIVRFGSTALPEPVPGQPADTAIGANLVQGTIRDVLGGGGADPTPERLRAVAERGLVGVLITRIELAADLGGATAESTLYVRGPRGWDRGMWRSASVRVGEVPPFVEGLVARDPQVRAILDLVDRIGGGLVTPEMKRDGLAVGTTAGGAAVMARATLLRSLAEIVLDIEERPATMNGPSRR